jgi:hypothetical protein
MLEPMPSDRKWGENDTVRGGSPTVSPFYGKSRIMGPSDTRLYERILNMAQMFNVGVFHRGENMLWTCRWTEEKEDSSIAYELVKKSESDLGIRLRYKVIDAKDKRERTLNYIVGVRSTLSYKKKTWYWFTCPLILNSVPCQRKVRNLYFLPNCDYFGCKYCRDQLILSLSPKEQRMFHRTVFVDERKSVTDKHGTPPVPMEKGWEPKPNRQVCPQCRCLSEGAYCCNCGRTLANTLHETFFEILGVGSDATTEMIHIAFKSRLKEYHPDRVAHLGQKLRFVAEEEIKHINLAYETLRDPILREEYMRQIAMIRSR